MFSFKIGGSPVRPTSDAAAGKKLKTKETAQAAEPSRSGFDTAVVNTQRLTVMPRMSTVNGNSAQHVQGETVESMLRDSAKELDDYFSRAYGF